MIYLVSHKWTPIHDCFDFTNAYTCVYMYVCVCVCFAIPPPLLAGLAPPPHPNIEKLPTPMNFVLYFHFYYVYISRLSKCSYQLHSTCAFEIIEGIWLSFRKFRVGFCILAFGKISFLRTYATKYFQC